tara:strand:+ start:253 stop:432 length:180 start_codon:yes stop_codon:yes gene_type:complete
MINLIKGAIFDGEYGKALTYLDHLAASGDEVLLDETVEDPQISFEKLQDNDWYNRKDTD